MGKDKRRLYRPQQESPHSSNLLVYVVKGLGVSVFVSLLFSVFLAGISLITDLASIEKYMPYIITGATLCSVFIGSVYATQQSGGKGLIIGVGVGVGYVLFSALFDVKISGEAILAIEFGQKLLITSIAGALGGIVGANL